jgi:hypothetical protein
MATADYCTPSKKFFGVAMKGTQPMNKSTNLPS